ncbi:hypothetical protein NtRootA1_21790 [Arthrobacter sp. NtRootA1]|nr:hypothetical protein NtRootA1_21790 [Arthrobacter sp. NtRootA1]
MERCENPDSVGKVLHQHRRSHDIDQANPEHGDAGEHQECQHIPSRCAADLTTCCQQDGNQ